MKILGVLIFLFLVSCNSGNEPQSCKEVCSSQNNISYSVTIPGDIRCFDMEMAAIREGYKKGYCDDGSLTTGRKAQDPEPILCQALIDAAQKKCEKLPPDPSQMDRQVSRTTTYKDGKLFMQNGELVDKCDCTKEHSGKPSTGKTTTEKASPTLPSQ